MVNLEILEKWLLVATETERLEFKEAKQQFDSNKLLKYCVGLANEGGGYIVLGVTDKKPRQVVGSQAWANPVDLNRIKAYIVEKLGFRVDASELEHPNGRVLVFEVPTRPLGQPIAIDGAYWMRAGEDLVTMTPDVLKSIFAEDKQDWFFQPAKLDVSPDGVIALLDTQVYFELLQIPYPTSREVVLERLQSQDFT